MNALDLYAKIEPLIGFYDEYEELYSSYLQTLQPLHVNTILDIGCGNGKFLKRLKENNFSAFGIDRSAVMVQRANELGVNASTQELCELEEGKYDCVVCIADVLNYIKPDELGSFFTNVSKVLKDKGYFLADVNTLAGFEFADGVMVRDEDEQFLAVEAFFEKTVLTTNITLFEKQEKKFQKTSGQVLQYYHPKKVFKNMKGFKLLKSTPVSMFSDEDEKSLMVFQKIKG